VSLSTTDPMWLGGVSGDAGVLARVLPVGGPEPVA
jgi:hypothetical protein